MSSILRSSKFVRYFVGLARNIVISNRHEVDGSLLQRNQHLNGLFSSSLSTTSSSLQVSSLERTVRRLDEDARKMGRISVKEIEEALNEIRHSKKASASQSLMVIRCCGNLVPEETPEQRTRLVEEIWTTLEKLGVSLDISHYNALLKVYLENEHKFSPTDFLANLEKKGVEPNRVTYQRLIAGYCQMGNIAGATKILEYMKEKQLPVSEGVFNALILGHSQADDMESAEGMLSVMRQANLEPSNETYATLLCGYARQGDKAALDRLVTECKVKDVVLYDRDILEVVYTAAINGHDELVDELLKNVKNMIGYNQDATNVLLRLVTRGKNEVAYKVFLTMQPAVRSENHLNMSGHILVKQMVKTDKPVEDIVALCERLAKDGHTTFGMWIAMETSFHHGNIDQTLGLLRAVREKHEPIRNHYFWPSLVTAGKAGDFNRILDILKKMVDDFNVSPNYETVKEYVVPYAGSKRPDEILDSLLSVGVKRGQSVVGLVTHLLTYNRVKDAMNLVVSNQGLNLNSVVINRLLVDVLHENANIHEVVALLHAITVSSSGVKEEDDEDAGSVEEIPSRFLQNIVFNPQARSKLPQLLQEMVAQGLSITNSCAETVEGRLQGNQLTTEISEMLAKLSSGDLTPSPIKRQGSGQNLARNPEALERIRERIKASNEPEEEKLISFTRAVYNAYCMEGDLENALRVKKEWVEDLKQELTVGWWAQLLSVYCAKDDFPGAKQCLEQIQALNQDLELDSSKILKVAKLYIQNNQFEEAIDLINKVKPREESGFQMRAAGFQALTATADVTKDPEQVKRLLDTLVAKNLGEITNVYLGPVIKAHLLRDDLEGALTEFERCVKTYRATPWKNDIAIRLIEKEDAARLQMLVDLSTQVHGEINSLYDLVLSFVECGRVRQARKILETPGLRSRNDRLQMACQRYKNEGLVVPLEGLVEATKDLPHIDRSDIYYNLLEIYCQANNAEKALGLWTQAQDEDVSVSDEFLVKLGNFLQSKGHHVPFEIPKTAVVKNLEKAEPKKSEPKKVEVQSSIYPSLYTAIRAKKVEEALDIFKSSQESGKLIGRNGTVKLLDLLINSDRLRDAVTVFSSLSPSSQLPTRTLNFLITRLSMSGQLELLERVGELLSEESKKLTSLVNKHLNCAVVAGKAKDELDKIERSIENANTPDEVDAAALVFPRGGIYAVLESSPSYHEQVTRIVDKFYSKGVSVPANCLCMYYMGQGQVDKGREVFDRYKLGNCSRLMFQSVLMKARVAQNPRLLEDLIDLLKSAPSTQIPEVQGILYGNLILNYVKMGDPETGLVKLEEGLKVTTLENIYPATLNRLKEALEANNISFKYTIPEKKGREDTSSSSSSSSDAEPQKSVAAKQ